MRQNLHPPGGSPALARLLSGMQKEIPDRRTDHENVPGLREGVHLPFKCLALAELLPGVPGKAQVTKTDLIQFLSSSSRLSGSKTRKEKHAAGMSAECQGLMGATG